MANGGGARTVAVVVALVLLLAGISTAAWLTSGQAVDGVTPSAAPPGVPAAGAGNSTVVLSDDAAGHPAATLVLEQIQLYFNAINNRDYPTWKQVVTEDRAAKQPRDQWLRGVGSTTDGSIRVDRITNLEGGRVLALVRFVSVQNPDDGPTGLKVGRICWWSSLPMSGSPPRMEVGEPENTLSAPC